MHATCPRCIMACVHSCMDYGLRMVHGRRHEAVRSSLPISGTELGLPGVWRGKASLYLRYSLKYCNPLHGGESARPFGALLRRFRTRVRQGTCLQAATQPAFTHSSRCASAAANTAPHSGSCWAFPPSSMLACPVHSAVSTLQTPTVP